MLDKVLISSNSNTWDSSTPLHLILLRTRVESINSRCEQTLNSKQMSSDYGCVSRYSYYETIFFLIGFPHLVYNSCYRV
jgi:hypothetical protein